MPSEELEATARLKVGLANLRDAGQLERLLREAPAPRLRRTGMALAAAAALVVIADCPSGAASIHRPMQRWSLRQVN